MRAAGVRITRIILGRRALAPIAGPVVEAIARPTSTITTWAHFALSVRSVAILRAGMLVALFPSIAGSRTLAQRHLALYNARAAVEAGHAFARIYITVCPCESILARAIWVSSLRIFLAIAVSTTFPARPLPALAWVG